MRSYDAFDQFTRNKQLSSHFVARCRRFDKMFLFFRRLHKIHRIYFKMEERRWSSDCSCCCWPNCSYYCVHLSVVCDSIHRVDCHHYYFIIDDHHLSCVTHKMTIEFPSFVSRCIAGCAFQWQFTLITAHLIYLTHEWNLSCSKHQHKFFWVTVKKCTKWANIHITTSLLSSLWFVALIRVLIATIVRILLFLRSLYYSVIINSGARSCALLSSSWMGKKFFLVLFF